MKDGGKDGGKDTKDNDGKNPKSTQTGASKPAEETRIASSFKVDNANAQYRKLVVSLKEETI